VRFEEKIRGVMMQIIYCDGASAQFQEGEFGKICVVSEEHGTHILDVLSSYATNNQCEWLAMREALLIANIGDEIRSDSQLVVGQLAKGWAVNAEGLKKLHAECAKLYAEKKVKVVWVRREFNEAGKVLERMKGTNMFDAVGSGISTEQSVELMQRHQLPFDSEQAFREIYIAEHYEKDKPFSEGFTSVKSSREE
jgi:ribonuclease HI